MERGVHVMQQAVAAMMQQVNNIAKEKSCILIPGCQTEYDASGNAQTAPLSPFSNERVAVGLLHEA